MVGDIVRFGRACYKISRIFIPGMDEEDDKLESKHGYRGSLDLT